MGLEIEHKYLVKDDSWKQYAESSENICQGYLSRIPERTVRVRTRGAKGYLTIKGKNKGDTRLEYEYEIPLAEAIELLNLCIPPVIEKTRHIVNYCGNTWEIDEFFGALSPLVIAEIELTDSNVNYAIPPFIGENVTNNPAYYNSNLAALNNGKTD